MQRLLARHVYAALLCFLAVPLCFQAAPAAAQTGTVTGRVTDAETGQPLASVQVQLLSGTTQAAAVLSGRAGRRRRPVTNRRSRP